MPPKQLLAGLVCSLVALHAHAQEPHAIASDRVFTRLVSMPLPSGKEHHAWVTDPSLRLEQQHLKQRIQAQLGLVTHPTGIAGLLAFLESLPITGRLLPVPSDPAVLLADPASNYALTQNSVVTQQQVPQRVTVLDDNGQLCHIGLSASLPIESLLRQCPLEAPSDEAWVIQHDGTVFQVFTSPWNRFSNALVAPGAWVWRPSRSLQADPSLSSAIASFLATQPLPHANVASLPPTVPPQERDEATHALGWKPLLSSNDWGETGLLQTPTARTGALGTLRFNASRAYPYTRMNVFLQPTRWLEFGFRYTDIATALYGANIAGEQTYKDKSFDFKTILSEEHPYLPQIAMGMRDIGGTGLFSSEYLVTSKRTESLDWSLGIGWGNMAAGGTLPNPLGALFPSLKQRKVESFGQGGTISTASMFAGDAALFGGVQWTSPSGRTALKLELEGNNYAHEPFGQNHGATSPLNLGWLYRVSPGVDVGVAFERGNKLAFSVTFSGNLRTMASPKPLDTPAPGAAQLISARTTAVKPMGMSVETTAASSPSPSPSIAAASLSSLTRAPSLASRLHSNIHAQTGWKLLSLDVVAGAWQIKLETDDAVYAQDRLERLFAVLTTELPTEGHVAEIQLSNFGLPQRSLRFDREEWLAQRVYPDLPSLQLSALEWQRPTASTAERGSSDTALVTAGTSNAPGVDRKPLNDRLETGWGTTFSHILGGPNNFLLYQAGLRAYAQYRFDENTWAFGQTNLRLADNYDNFVYNAPSNLPRVRTDQRRYVTTSRTTVPVVQLTRTVDLGHGHYASAYGGLLEPMYAGIGGEWLWRPWNANWALGADINQVQQRAYEQDFALRDYRTTTGHATLYWNTGFDGVLAKVSAGKYLAKDVGVTVDLSRSFANGTSIGVWATKTNVSVEQFGEGSFDKGIYLNIPLDALLPRSTPSMATFVWSPLTRDGGARLSRRFALFDLTRHADTWAWRYRTASENTNHMEERNESPSLLSALFPHNTGRGGLGESLQLGGAMARAGVHYNNLLAGAGAVLLTMAVDKPIANTFGNNNGSASQIGQAFNSIPYLLAAGAGTAAIGAWGEDARSTAYASLSAATWALGTNLVAKSLIGRARPDEGHGAWAFNGPSSSSPQSSFASNHVTAAMALATPFAQRYEQPWLYGLASLTAVGRIQSNEHWASDTVAAALLGYAFGTLALDQQTQRHKRWALSASTNHIAATLQY